MSKKRGEPQRTKGKPKENPRKNPNKRILNPDNPSQQNENQIWLGDLSKKRGTTGEPADKEPQRTRASPTNESNFGFLVGRFVKKEGGTTGEPADKEPRGHEPTKRKSNFWFLVGGVVKKEGKPPGNHSKHLP